MTPEGMLKKQICQYLEARKIFFWVNQAGKIPGRRLLKTGISDILGIYKGRPLALEVKAAKGRVSEEQKMFLEEWTAHGGIGGIVRSLEDVIDILGAA